jgi:hypothetical protein
MKTERRWLKSVLAAAAQPQPAMPWERGNRRRPAAFAVRPAAMIAPPRPSLAAR